jgi:hypothetical protein
MIVEKNAAMITSAAKTFAYSAQPCAQLTYQAETELHTDRFRDNEREE